MADIPQQISRQLTSEMVKRKHDIRTYFSTITFAAALIFFAISCYLIFGHYTQESLETAVHPVFYVLLYQISLPYQVALFYVLITMFSLYSFFFIIMIVKSRKMHDFGSPKSPVAFFIFFSSISLLLTSIIIFSENGLGIQIGGSALNTYAEQHPLIGYSSLIYAPFVEEFGFRILPLGLFSAVWLSVKKGKIGKRADLKDILMAVFVPGPIREKYGIKLGKIDWLLIFATSVLFAYAHIFFGNWDWGKFAETFVFGVFAAYGFLKFGAYMDIPMHWFTNGLFGLFILDSSLEPYLVFFTIWITLFVGVAGIILMSRASKAKHFRFGIRPD